MADSDDQISSRPSPPDPGIDLAILLAWTKKMGLTVDFERCERKWNSFENGEDLLRIIRPFMPDKLRIGRTREGDLALRIIDRAWADQWACHYGVEQKHHGQSAHSTSKRR
jgi:hypothetical protein